MTVDEGPLIIEQLENGVCLLRLNRPRRYNAMSREMVDRLDGVLAEVEVSDARVVIITGASPGFCAGADLKERKAMNDDEKFSHNRAINSVINRVAALAQPTIAVMNGIALGGGCELALACDLRFASADASIGLTEARLGAMPGAGGSQRLPRLIGTARALQMMLSGEPVDARRALDWGLLNGVFEADELEAQAIAFGQLLASRSRRTASMVKKLVYTGIELPLEDALALEGASIAEVLSSPDYREGLTAFAERRAPRFE